MIKKAFSIALGAVAALGLSLGTAQAQGWKPTKHVEIIVGADGMDLGFRPDLWIYHHQVPEGRRLDAVHADMEMSR